MTNRHTPALLGGLFIGVLSSLPAVGACCCLWAVCGGMLVTYLQQQNSPEPIETADAVLGGVFAGVIGALIASIVPIVLVSMGGESFEEMMRSALESSSEIPAEWRDRVLGFVSGRNIVLLLFVVNIPMYAVFAMLGSLLGVAFFRKKTPPPAPQG
jgi:hypothetical protein